MLTAEFGNCDINCIIGITLSLLCLFVISGVIVVNIERNRKCIEEQNVDKQEQNSQVTLNRVSVAIERDDEHMEYDDILIVQETTVLESEYETIDEDPIYDYPLGEDNSVNATVNMSYNIDHSLVILNTTDSRGAQFTDQPQNDDELNTSANVAYVVSKFL